MITLIEALNFRCLRYIRQPLGPFNVLVGPNASGKTTFIDVVAFLGDLVSKGLEKAIYERSFNLQDLIWDRSGDRFELAIEAEIPKNYRNLLNKKEYEIVRYEVAIGIDPITMENVILAEKALLKIPHKHPPNERFLFPMWIEPPDTIQTSKGPRGTKTIINKISGGNDNFYDETGKGWDHSFKLGSKKSALGNLPDDESKFPVTMWLKKMLIDGVQQFVLNSMLIRKPSPPGQVKGFKPDGSNLPWVIEDLYKKHPARFKEWIQHLQTALIDIEDIHTIERPEDKNRYLIIRYKGGVEIPSWMVSDGTLRLLALTLPAFYTDFKGIYLIEEPENGIHPIAVETMVQSLSSVYHAQVILATHSPVFLSVVDVDKILCFAKNEDNSTDIVNGTEHPALKDWRGEVNLGDLFAGGVLG